MKEKYIISIEEGNGYPFDGPKLDFNKIQVRTQLSCNSQDSSIKINSLLKITSPFLIGLQRVLQLKGKKFILDFEYVAEPLKTSIKIGENGFLSAVKQKLHQLMQLFAQNGIKKEIKIQDIGITEENQPKIFLGTVFDVCHQSDKENLMIEYQNQVERLFQSNFNFRETIRANSDHTHVSDYSQRLDKKIIEMQDRLNKMKCRQSIRSQKSNPSSDKSKRKHGQDNLVLQSMNEKKSSNNSFTSGITCSSCIDTNQLNRGKIHKSSFGDYSTTSHRLNQSSHRDNSLTKRISNALQKTQQAFNIYEKYSKKQKRR